MVDQAVDMTEAMQKLAWATVVILLILTLYFFAGGDLKALLTLDGVARLFRV